ncbi:MAG: hypothetical protein KF760_08175 [Candidatus Eremiobacteraeota bacterium]|nr:hypothetical protein [Candidatus Eremiobacteraeota bacterium]MCW5867955.1 hypothetical protein [Candidatus Eremiobacteraeota bacterium]
MISFSTNPENVTDLPAFNDFQLAVQGVLEGHSDEQELGKVYQQLDSVLGQALFYFCDQVHFQPASDHLEAQSQLVYRHIDGVRDEAELACKACLIADEAEANLHLDAARQELIQLTTLFAAMKKEEEAQPRFSPLPWIHELCRVAVAYRQGQLSEEHLAERLETSRQLHQRAALSIPQVPSLIHDRQRWRELITSMEASLAGIGEGLQAVDAFLDTADGDTLDAGLELCMGGAEKLMEDYATIKRLEEEQPGLQCPLCSKENPLGTQRCGHCSAPLPRLSDMEEAMGQGEVSWPSHVQSLVQSLEGLQGGSRQPGVVLGEVQQMRERFERGIQDFKKMKIPEGLEQAEEARERLLQGSQAAIGSLEQMAQAIKDEQWDFVNTALQQFLQQVDGLLEALPQ